MQIVIFDKNGIPVTASEEDAEDMVKHCGYTRTCDIARAGGFVMPAPALIVEEPKVEEEVQEPGEPAMVLPTTHDDAQE